MSTPRTSPSCATSRTPVIDNVESSATLAWLASSDSIGRIIAKT
ncbi:hypothetical protein [Cellulomonas sp. ICMP 17802]